MLPVALLRSLLLIPGYIGSCNFETPSSNKTIAVSFMFFGDVKGNGEKYSMNHE